MSTIQQLLHCDGCTSRTRFVRNTLLLAAAKAAIDLQVLQLRPDLAPEWSWSLAWLNPFHLIDPWLEGGVPFLICLTTFAFFAGLVWNAVHRTRDAGWNHWLGLVTAVPFANVVMALVLSFAPGRKRSIWDLV